MTPSNTTLGSVLSQVRENALSSFEYFANAVMAQGLSEDLCRFTQEVVEDKEDCVLKTQRPKALLVALHAWLSSKGYAVLSTSTIPDHEVLRWLDLKTPTSSSTTEGVALDLRAEGVSVQWL